jgi:PAS domain S-box-containing protein
MKMMFKNITLKYKILIMSLLEISALLLLFFVSQIFMERNTTLLSHIENSFVPALELGRDLEQMLTEIQRSMQDAVGAADKDAFPTIDTLYNKFLQLFEKGQTNPFFEAKKLDPLKSEFQGYYVLARKTSLQLIEGRSLDEELIGNLGMMRERYNSIKTQLQSKTTQAKNEVSASFSTALKNSRRSAIIMNIIIISCSILLGGLSLFLSQSITGPLRSLVDATNRIAHGDLTQKIIVHSNDELAVLGNAMERMRGELQQFYQRLEHLVNERTQSLQESEERFRQVVTSISDHIYTGELSEDGEWITRYHSPNIEPLTGYRHEKFMEDSYFWPSLIFPDDKPAVDVQLTRFFSGQNSEVEYRLIHKNGTIVWVRDSGRLESHTGQKNKIVYGVVSDITQRKQAEEKQAQLQAQLRQAQKLEAIGKLAGGTAHEFNNILAILLGTMELTMDNLPEDSPERIRLEQAYKTGERGRDLVQQILVFSRSSQQALQPLQFAPILQNTIKVVQSTLPPTVRLHQHIDPACSPVLANPLQIEQVVINLCKNAVQAMDKRGGSVEIALEEVAPSSASPHFSELSENSYVKLTISDNGSGMSPDVKNRIFDPFFTTKEVGKGTGLGLSVVHGIIQQHGGKIRVESELGKGTTFEIAFPVVQESTQSKTVEETPSAQPQKDHRKLGEGKHILIVDNDPESLKLPIMALKKLNYRVTVISESREALNRIRTDSQQFDVVITALTMPEMTGTDLCREAMRIRPDIPLILCTEAYESVETRTAEEVGIVRFLQKPLKIRQLTQTLREVLLSLHS